MRGARDGNEGRKNAIFWVFTLRSLDGGGG